MISFIANSRPRYDLLAANDLFRPGTQYSVLRLDRLHPEISGNKWFKLQVYLEMAETQQKHSLVSFGGPYSNHLVALAAAGKALGYKTTGIVRGEAPALLSPSVQQMQELGMELRFTDRQTYRNWQQPDNLAALQTTYPGAILIPEGGMGEAGRLGAAAIAKLPGMDEYTHLCMAVGTGTTIAGLATGSLPFQQLTGIPVLRGTSGHEPLPETWMRQIPGAGRIKLLHGFDEGGYARHSPDLLVFMNRFFDAFHIPSDFVYTGKLFFAIARLSWEGYFPQGSRVLMIHSGGLQGNRSLPVHSLHF